MAKQEKRAIASQNSASIREKVVNRQYGQSQKIGSRGSRRENCIRQRSSSRLLCIVALVMFIGCSAAIFLIEPAGAIDREALHVEGRQLKHGNRDMVLRGINVETHAWGYECSTYNASSRRWTYCVSENGECNYSKCDESVLDAEIKAPWILGDADFTRIRSWGANMVRLQIPHYMLDSIGYPYRQKDDGFALLDRWLYWAGQHQLYVILDLHVPHGGRQYNVGTSKMEGKTFWLNPEYQDRLRVLWKSIALRYKDQKHVLFQLMNEPYPENETGNTDAGQWWKLAQALIDDIRQTGATNVIVLSSPLGPIDTAFRLCNDTANNLMYDVHFYLPYEFTHQRAWWWSQYDAAVAYPSEAAKEYLTWTSPPNKVTGNFNGSSTWQDWSEPIDRVRLLDALKGIEVITGDPPRQIPNKLFLSPAMNSWNNSGNLDFDNYRVCVDNAAHAVTNSTFESGSPENLPMGWDQWKSSSGLPSVTWQPESSNHFVRIPPTPNKASHSFFLTAPYAISMPADFGRITLTASVKGENTSQGTILGANWYQEYNQESMKTSLAPFINFGTTHDVPIMCLEFGVIMNATENDGHLKWLDDLRTVLQRRDLHLAYHSYRGFSDSPDRKAFGIYQCWGSPAGNCSNKYGFVIPTLKLFYGPNYYDTVQRLYIGYYQRPADPEGLLFWANGLQSADAEGGTFDGGNFMWVLEQFAFSEEARKIYGGDASSTNITTIIDKIYLGLFNRHAESDGLFFWVNSFNTGASTPASILWEVMKGAQFTDKGTLNNKVTASNRFTQALDPDLDGLPPFYAGYPSWATDWLSAVTCDPATIPTEDAIRALF